MWAEIVILLGTIACFGFIFAFLDTRASIRKGGNSQNHDELTCSTEVVKCPAFTYEQ